MSATVDTYPDVLKSSVAVKGTDEQQAAPHQTPHRNRDAKQSMNAAFISQAGGVETIQYGKLPRPIPTAGQVLIKVGAVAVNPIDAEICSGALQMPLRFPYVVGSDLAGTVTMRGIGVRRFSVGDRVWGTNQGLYGRQGTFSEYVAVDEKWLYPTPLAQTDAEAAAGAMVGITAQLGLFQTARLRQGEIVFVHGGAGGVGSAVVQQAKSAGARVITTAGSQHKRAWCRDLQADLVLDYRSQTFDDELREFVAPFGGIDIWMETQREANFERITKLMAAYGRIVLIAPQTARDPFPVEEFQAKDLTLLGVSRCNSLPNLQRECADALNEQYVLGHWRPRVGMIFSLAKAAEAQQLTHADHFQKRGTPVGKIVLIPDE